ncbi:ML2 [Symbiodinium pilosum]|uniref:ML2 protein n=1 Tax=Symbiodinium pilosum TaxID=2952 RepID=A0A812PK72_SYMPI|nr:ML2 [Symbiodinium pilosum]
MASPAEAATPREANVCPWCDRQKVSVEACPCDNSEKDESKARGRRRRRRRHRSRSRLRDVFEPYHACAVPRASTLVSELADNMPVSTVMLRNIPCRYTQGSLMQEVDQLGFDGCYDFFYFPMDMRNKNSVGYAFINFRDPTDAERFVEVMRDHRFRRHASEKLPKASPAHLQGLRNNILHFANRAVANCRDTRYRPVVLDQGGRRVDLQEALLRLGGEGETFSEEAQSEMALAQASRCFEAAKAKLEVAIVKVLADAAHCAGEEADTHNDNAAQVSLKAPELAFQTQGWVERALLDLAQEADTRWCPGFAAGWVAETFSKLVGGTPVTPRGTCRVDVLLEAPPIAWEHPQGKAGGWVDEAFVALTDDCCQKELPSRSLCEGRVGSALQRLKAMGGWAWVAFA